MSSNATFDSRKAQVLEGNSQKHQKGIKPKTKCSKSSGSISKSVVCSSCDDNDTSEHDAEKRPLSTSDPSSTNVIFFKDITDSSINSVEDNRVPLRPGKRRSICSKLGMQKKVKVFKGPEGMDDSVENFSEIHKELRLKIPEKQFTKKRPISSEIPYFRRTSPQRGDRVIRIKRPSTAGVVNDVPPTKYPESIFKVFMKPQEKLVKKRIIPLNNEDDQYTTPHPKKPVKSSSRNLLVGGFLAKKKSAVTYGRKTDYSCPTEKITGRTKRDELLDEQKTIENQTKATNNDIGDCRPSTDVTEIEETEENGEIKVQKSKSTLRSHGHVKPVTSKRSVHWEDEVLLGKNKLGSSGEIEGSWEQECQKRTNRIRRMFQKSVWRSNEKFSTTKALHEDTKLQPLDPKNSNTSNKNITFSKLESKQSSELIVERLEVDLKPTMVLRYPSKGRKSDCVDERDIKSNKGKPSSSESEILRRQGKKYHSETSEDTDEQSQSSVRSNGRIKYKLRRRNSCGNHSQESCNSGDDECNFGMHSAKRSKKSADVIIIRRTSSPAILNSKDSCSRLIRGKSSPAMNRKLKSHPSNTTMSSSSLRSESSNKNTCEWFGIEGERDPDENKCYYEQASLKENIENLAKHTKNLNRMLSKENLCEAIQEVQSKKKHLKNPPKLLKKKTEFSKENDALSSFKECLRETEECLEKLKSEIQKPEARGRAELIKKIHAKLSKIRHQVDKVNDDTPQEPTITAKKGLSKNKDLDLASQHKSSEGNENITKEKEVIATPKKVKSEVPTIKTKSHPNIPRPSLKKTGSPVTPTKIQLKSEKSKKILESWEFMEKSIGERSEKMLKTIRTMREKQLALVSSPGKDKDECISASNNVSAEKVISTNDNENNPSIGSDLKDLQSQKYSPHVALETTNNIPGNNEGLMECGVNETLNIQQKESNYVSDNKDLLEVTLVVNKSRFNADIKEMQDNSINLSLNVLDKPESKESSVSPNFILVGGISNAEIINNMEINISKEDLKSQSTCSIGASENLKEIDDSALSSPSFEHVTTASIESLPNEVHDVSQHEHDSSAKSSPPASKGRVKTPERKGPLQNSSKKSAPERPPSRKPYFSRNSSEDCAESIENSLSHVRIQSHQPRSRNTPASTRISSATPPVEGVSKKPPPSRMYSTLKETPFYKKESIKSAIKNLNLTPKPSQKKVTLSSPPTADSISQQNQHVVPVPPRPSTAKKERMSSFGKVVSSISPSSLEILKKKTMAIRERNSSSRPETADNVSSAASSGGTKALSRTLDHHAFMKRRQASATRTTTPVVKKNKSNHRLKGEVPSTRESRPITPKPHVEGPSSCKPPESPKNKTTPHKVSFNKEVTKHPPPTEPERKPYERVPLSKRLPNYRPPWERVDLRPPESALAERALHEKRLFGGPRSTKRRSDMSGLRTPTSDSKTPNKSSNIATSGTPTNSTLTVNTNDVPRHVRARERMLGRRFPTKQL